MPRRSARMARASSLPAPILPGCGIAPPANRSASRCSITTKFLPHRSARTARASSPPARTRLPGSGGARDFAELEGHAAIVVDELLPAIAAVVLEVSAAVFRVGPGPPNLGVDFALGQQQSHQSEQSTKRHLSSKIPVHRVFLSRVKV